LPAPIVSALFPATRWSSSDTVPRSLARPGSSSPELHLTYRVCPVCHLPDAREHQAPPLGFRFPFAASIHGVHSHRASHARLTFRPQRFSRSRRFPPPHTAWACFIPKPRPGFALQGVSPLPSRLTSSMSRALMPLAKLSYWQVAPPAPDPRASTSRHSSEQRSVATSRRFRPESRSIPS